jgi:hypothetical protein
MNSVRLVGLLTVIGPALLGLAGCARQVSTYREPPLVEVVRVADADADDSGAGAEVNGLALTLSARDVPFRAGWQDQLKLTLHNRSDKSLQVALHDQGCCLWGNLRFDPELPTGGSGHTVSPNHFPGGVHLIFGGSQLALKFRLARSPDGSHLYLPNQAHNGLGCGNTFMIPAGLKKVALRFRLYDSPDAAWSNLKFTEQRWSGECVSNAVALQLE